MTIALLLLLAAGPRWESPTTGGAPAGCIDRVSSDAGLDEALRGLTVEVGGEARPITEVRLTGLTTLPEPKVWQAVGAGWETRQGPYDARRVVALVRRLEALGVFARVTPLVRIKDAQVTVEIAVVEHPTVAKVVFEGLTEIKPHRLLEAVLPNGTRDSDGEGDDELGKKIKAKVARKIGKKHGDKIPSPPPPAGGPLCPEPVVLPEWFASLEGEAVHPGILRDGVRPALERLVHALHDLGYELSSFGGELRDRALTVHVDEGRLSGVEIRGVSPVIEAGVRARLDLHPGRPFQSGELDGALERVQRAYPFLERGHAGPAPAEPKVEVTTEPGQVRFQTVAAPATLNAVPATADDDDDDDDQPHRAHGRWYELHDHNLVLTFASDRSQLDTDFVEILRHTPVTGFAPGLVFTGRISDPSDRVNAAFDLGGNVNTHRAQRLTTDPAATPERWRFDWVAGGRIQVPRLRLAEVGLQGYARVDTSDRWRIDRIDSYLYSMLFDRAYSDYYRREGFTAFLTFHLFEHLTAGAEYRQDRYRSLVTADKAYSLFNRGEPRRPMAPVTEGQMRSLLFRLEYTTAEAPLRDVGGVLRDPERTLVSSAVRRKAELRTSNTVEVADPSALGGDAAFHFVKLVSDSTLEEPFGEHHRVELRFRAAGRLGDGTLPLQKEEALGGWTALRGYDYKEFPGANFSLLGTLAYGYHPFAAFLDIGSVRTGTSFTTTRAAAGLSLDLGEAHLDFAWRLDDRAKVLPQVRFFFRKTF
jgi:hypothetical protein